jgi:hypothetical protein
VNQVGSTLPLSPGWVRQAVPQPLQRTGSRQVPVRPRKSKEIFAAAFTGEKGRHYTVVAHAICRSERGMLLLDWSVRSAFLLHLFGEHEGTREGSVVDDMNHIACGKAVAAPGIERPPCRSMCGAYAVRC